MASFLGKVAATAGGPVGAYFRHAFFVVLIAAPMVTFSVARLETARGILDPSSTQKGLPESPGKHGGRWQRYGLLLKSPVVSGLAQDTVAHAAEHGAHGAACREGPCQNGTSGGGSLCCRCYSKDVTWSASGECTKCAGPLGGTVATWDVPDKCRFQDEEDRKTLVSSEAQREDCAVKCEETQPPSSRSQCCLCKNEDVSWSASGTCNKCEGRAKDAIMMWDPPDSCHYERPADKAYLMDKRRGGKRRQQCGVDCASTIPGEGAGDSLSLCCLCKDEDETIAWSASGSCSNCQNLGGYRTRWQVSVGCNHYNPEEKSAIENSQAFRQGCADKCILDQPAAGQSQCCLCKSGAISWSASGTCSKCSDKGSKRQWKVEEGCRYHNSEDRAVLESDPQKRNSCQASCEESQSPKTKYRKTRREKRSKESA